MERRLACSPADRMLSEYFRREQFFGSREVRIVGALANAILAGQSAPGSAQLLMIGGARDQTSFRRQADMDLSYNPRPRFTEWAIKSRLLSSPFVVVDVGVLGGISHRWKHFGDYLEAHGFDVLDEAIAPLKTLGHPR